MWWSPRPSPTGRTSTGIIVGWNTCRVGRNDIRDPADHPGIPSRPLDHHRDALADADAHARETPALLAEAQLTREGQDEASPRGAERMAEGDRPAVHVHALGVEADLLDA